MAETLIRVILVEDHAIVLNGLEKLFAHDGRFRVVACCRRGEDALRVARRGAADVMVLDLRMPGLSGLDILRTVTTDGLPCRVVVLTAAVSDEEALEAIDLGARGLVLKESSPDVLMECVVRVHAGEQWIDPQTLTSALGRARRQHEGRQAVSKVLTPREIEIVRLVAEGYRNKPIADRLSISEGTVKIHLHNVYEKTGVAGRLELVLWLKAQGLD
jgi:DNA-binding NarL/FixJ family response regulator